MYGVVGGDETGLFDSLKKSRQRELPPPDAKDTHLLNMVTMGSGNGLSPKGHQATTWTL